MKVLQCVASLDPALGGSVEAPRLLTVALLKQGHSVEVLTLEQLRAGWTDAWPAIVHWAGPARGRYLYSRNLVGWLQVHARDYDVLVVHGVWRYMSVGVWRALRRSPVPYVLYTHGMLDPFYNVFPIKRIKKLFHWRLFEHKVVRDARMVIFTCEEERVLAASNFKPFTCKASVLNLGIETPPLNRGNAPGNTPWPAELEGKQVLLFLARLEPQKGCDTLVQAFARITAANPGVHLLVVGPDLVGWKPTLINLARQSGVAERITWHEPVYGETKWQFFRRADAYILPTNFENFGISIVEALACGLPVLISNKAAIWRDIEKAGAGFVSANTVEGTVGILQQWLALSPQTKAEMSSNAFRCFCEHYEIDGVATRLSVILASACGVIK